MNTKLILAMGALLAFAGAAQAGTYSGTRTVVSPGTVEVPGALSAGVALCDNVSPASPLFCASGGFGAFFTDLLVPVAPDTGTGYSNSDDYATGTCAVSFGTGSGGSALFSCGNDRDDDDFVTNVDAAGSSRSSGYDDEYVDGVVGNSATFCFSRDRSTVSDPTLDVAPGNDWDDVVVFVGFQAGSAPFVGTLNVDLNGTSSGNSCGTLSGQPAGVTSWTA